ncbi:putative transporter small subunit [Glutamicibacter sp.]
MTTFFLSLYVLVWPVIVAGVLFFISKGFVQEWLEARRNGEDII